MPSAWKNWRGMLFLVLHLYIRLSILSRMVRNRLLKLGVRHFIERCFSRHDIWSTRTNSRYHTSSNHYLVEILSKLFDNVNCKSDQ